MPLWSFTWLHIGASASDASPRIRMGAKRDWENCPIPTPLPTALSCRVLTTLSPLKGQGDEMFWVRKIFRERSERDVSAKASSLSTCDIRFGAPAKGMTH